MYHDIFQTKKWTMYPWDLDKTFFRYGFLTPYHRTSSYFSPDNPFIERALLCEPVFNDIRKRIDELTLDFFNNSYFDPIIDSLKIELMESVAEDTADDIIGVDTWLVTIEKNKNYVMRRYNELQYQFNNYPRSFSVEPTRGYYSDSVKFVWHPSSSPTGKKIAYDFYFGPNQNLEDGKATIIKDLTDTTFTLTNLPPDGKYWWKVTVYDGSDYVDGFNYPNPINIKEPTPIPCRIDESLTLIKNNSPYSVNCNVEIRGSADLIIEPGVEIIFQGNYQLKVNGSLQAEGSKEFPVKFTNSQFIRSWRNLEFRNTTKTCNLKNLIIENGSIYSVNSSILIDSLVYSFNDTSSDIGIMYFDKTNVSMYNSTISSNGKKEGFVVLNANNIVTENCRFNNVPDAIEYVWVDTGIIRNNKVYNATDDCIDINGCSNILIYGNSLNGSPDKGISIGPSEPFNFKSILV